MFAGVTRLLNRGGVTDTAFSTDGGSDGEEDLENLIDEVLARREEVAQKEQKEFIAFHTVCLGVKLSLEVRNGTRLGRSFYHIAASSPRSSPPSAGQHRTAAQRPNHRPLGGGAAEGAAGGRVARLRAGEARRAAAAAPPRDLDRRRVPNRARRARRAVRGARRWDLGRGEGRREDGGVEDGRDQVPAAPEATAGAEGAEMRELVKKRGY